MRSRKRRNIYAEMAEHFNKKEALIRKVAHHPFEFLHDKITDDEDHGPIRLRYLGLFYVKPGWRKNMHKAIDLAPPEGIPIHARVPAWWKRRIAIFLQQGVVRDGIFYNDYGTQCEVSKIQYWKEMSPEEIENNESIKEL